MQRRRVPGDGRGMGAHACKKDNEADGGCSAGIAQYGEVRSRNSSKRRFAGQLQWLRLTDGKESGLFAQP